MYGEQVFLSTVWLRRVACNVHCTGWTNIHECVILVPHRKVAHNNEYGIVRAFLYRVNITRIIVHPVDEPIDIGNLG